VLHTREGDVRGGNVTAWNEANDEIEQLVGYEVKVLGVRGDWPTPNALASVVPRGAIATDVRALYNHIPGATLTEDGPDGQWRLRLTDMVSMRHAASLSRHASHAYFIDWMGRLREASIFPIRRELGRDLLTGEWGLVTNSTHLVCERPVAAGDIIEASFFVRQRGGSHDATLHFGFEWVRLEEGERTTVARGFMETTWVIVMGHGQVEPRPFPAYFDRFLRQVLPTKSGTPSLAALRDASLGGAEVELGPSMWALPRTSLTGPVVHEHIVHTGQTHSNLVGNVYYANYSTWQVAAVDAMLEERVPAMFRSFSAARGELRCSTAAVRHLREAMPFDTVAVTIHLQELCENGVRLLCEFWRLDNGARTKLAFGEIVAEWSVATADGSWQSQPLPDDLRRALLIDASPPGESRVPEVPTSLGRKAG
jgi:acyl-CoA thioesterase FadM